MPKRRRPCPLPLVLALATALPALPALGASPEDATFAAETREYLGRLERLGFAGAVLVARGGEPLFAEGYGLADRERGIPWSPGTVSTVGSITKQFTGAAILALAEDGRLRVEDPITAHFEGVPEDKRAITLHQLLTHSSGVVDLEGYGDWDPIGREEFVERILAQPLAFEPGTGYQYSNAGYSLLGAIIERLAGGSYERFVRERFFVPLGMYETGYVEASWGAGRIAQGYRGGLPPRLRFRAEASGALAAWDPRSGGTAWLTTEGAGSETHLRFGRGEQALEARRVAPDGWRPN